MLIESEKEARIRILVKEMNLDRQVILNHTRAISTNLDEFCRLTDFDPRKIGFNEKGFLSVGELVRISKVISHIRGLEGKDELPNNQPTKPL